MGPATRPIGFILIFLLFRGFGVSFTLAANSVVQNEYPDLGPDDVSICMLMLTRDEEMLLRRHLQSWLPLLAATKGASNATAHTAPALVVAIDDRTSDASARLFVAPSSDDSSASSWESPVPFSLVPRNRRHVFHYTFEGLGPGRSLLLQEAWDRFGRTVSHYFFVDPDWRLNLVDGEALNFGAALRRELTAIEHRNKLIFAFRIYDRNGHSQRWLDWFMRAEPGLSFKYRWHEALDVPPTLSYTFTDMNSFTVTETEGEMDSYHKRESGGSNTLVRFDREIAFLELDLQDYPDDPRVLYYLGVDHASILSILRGRAGSGGFDHLDREKYLHHWRAAASFLRRRNWNMPSRDEADEAHAEMAWGAAMWLGRVLSELRHTEDTRKNAGSSFIRDVFFADRESVPRDIGTPKSLDEEAIEAFDRCIKLDTERIECYLQKVRVALRAHRKAADEALSEEFSSTNSKVKKNRKTSKGGVTLSLTPVEAWSLAAKALTIPEPMRSFLHVPYYYSCVAPAVAAEAAIVAGGSIMRNNAPDLLSRASNACTQGVPDEPPQHLQQLAKEYLRTDKSADVEAETKVEAKTEVAATVNATSSTLLNMTAQTKAQKAPKNTKKGSGKNWAFWDMWSEKPSKKKILSDELPNEEEVEVKEEGHTDDAAVPLLQSEIVEAERDEAVRWLRLAQKSLGAEEGESGKHDGSSLSPETSMLFAKALAAQPGNATVQRIVGEALSGKKKCKSDIGVASQTFEQPQKNKAPRIKSAKKKVITKITKDEELQDPWLILRAHEVRVAATLKEIALGL